jgi:hypothetical protein
MGAHAVETPLIAGDAERIARLEERMTVVLGLLAEIRQEQKEMTDTIARASGGMRVLLLLGGIAGLAGVARAVIGATSAWLAHGGH